MGPLLLIITVLIWGTAFLAQKSGADSLGPFAMTALRAVLGAAFLAGCLGVRRLFRSVAPSSQPSGSSSALAGLACGVPLFAAMYAQQAGIETITPGVSAFLTANYVLLVPLGAAALLHRRVTRATWAGVALALVGTWFVCMGGESLALGRGEAWTLLCAVLFAAQMLLVDHFTKRCDVLAMSFYQLVACAALGGACLLFSAEGAALTLANVKAAAGALLYVGILSSGVAYTLQNFGQARTPPALAAIICSLESVVSALAGWLWRGDVLTARQFLGCALVLAAVLVSQLFALTSASPARPDADPAK